MPQSDAMPRSVGAVLAGALMLATAAGCTGSPEVDPTQPAMEPVSTSRRTPVVLLVEDIGYAETKCHIQWTEGYIDSGVHRIRDSADGRTSTQSLLDALSDKARAVGANAVVSVRVSIGGAGGPGVSDGTSRSGLYGIAYGTAVVVGNTDDLLDSGDAGVPPMSDPACLTGPH